MLRLVCNYNEVIEDISNNTRTAKVLIVMYNNFLKNFFRIKCILSFISTFDKRL